MKTVLICLAGLVFAGSVIALPLTDADDGNQFGIDVTARREGLGAVRVAQVRVAQARVAQARPTKEKVAKQKALGTKAAARENSARRKGAVKTSTAAKSKRAVPVTAEMEAKVGEFVSKHHRELLDVLAHLKDNLAGEHERAVRELDRTRHRLQQLEGRDRYAAELELWKALSRARLLGARVQMDDDDGLRDALREKLAEIYDLRASMVQRDRDRAAERLQKLDSQLRAMRGDREENLKKQLAALTKTTKKKRSKPAKTSAESAKPARRNQNSDTKKSSNKTID